MEDLGPRNNGWVVTGGNMHEDVRCPPRPRVGRVPQSPLPRSAHPPPASSSALRATLCQEESLPGHRGSPGAAMRRMSALCAGRAVLSGPAPNTPTPQRHAFDTPPPAERRRHGNGITGAGSAVYSQPSARKLCREAARRTSLGGGGREPVIGHKSH